MLVDINGPAVGSVGYFTYYAANAGYIAVTPASPNTLGPGTYSSTLTVRACIDSPTCATGELTGSPRTVTVNYTVNAYAPRRDSVTPRVDVAGKADDVVIRGTNLSGATSLSFGAQPATSFTVVSPTEIRARHPALAAGTYPIAINGGATAFTASLVTTNPQTYAATTLPYPSPAPAQFNTQRPRYDAERQSIYLVLPPAVPGPTNPLAGGRLLKYTYVAGTWSNAQVGSIDGLRDVVLGPDGDVLLGFTPDALLEIDPATLAVRATYPVPPDSMRDPGLNFFINNLALTNDGYAIVTFGCGCGSAFAPVYFFDTASHGFRRMDPAGNHWSLNVDGGKWPRASVNGDGSRVLIGDAFRYQPSDGSLSAQYFAHALRDNNGVPLVEMDRKATRLVLNATTDVMDSYAIKYVDVYDGNYQLLGRIGEPLFSPTHNMFAAVSQDGTRAYVLHYDFTQDAVVAMSTFDISAPPPPGGFPLVGSRTALPMMTRANWWNAGIPLTPDGRTLLIAADNGLFVQPVP